MTETNATNGDRFKFAGMEYDSTTGQYYDRARDYDATIGRFMSLDPMGFEATDFDLYRYVGNGPTDTTDPTGLAYRVFLLVDTLRDGRGRPLLQVKAAVSWNNQAGGLAGHYFCKSGCDEH